MGYLIRASVSGGVTGSRTAFLRDGSDRLEEFDSLGEAQEEAERLNRAMNGPRSTARFSYVPVPKEDAR